VLETAVNGGADMIATFDPRHLASAATRLGIAVAPPGTIVRRYWSSAREKEQLRASPAALSH
jgi:hypothetical protein